MQSNSIQKNGVNKASDSGSKPVQKTQSGFDASSLIRQISDMQERVSEMRMAKAISSENNEDSNGSQKSNNYLEQVYLDRELQYLSRISNLQGQLEEMGINDFSQNSQNNLPNYGNNGQSLAGSFNNGMANSNSVSSDFGNGFQSFLGGIGNGFNSLTEGISNGFNSFKEAVGGGLQAIGTALSDAKNWFVSQLPGATNINENSGKNNGNCWAACLEMVWRLSGGADKNTKTFDGDASTANNDIESRWRSAIGAMDESKGATPEEIAKAAQKNGMKASVSVGTLDSAQAGKTILAVDPSKYKDGLAPSGHAVVFLGIDQASGMALIADPAEQNGPIKVSVSALQNAMDAMGNRMVQIS